MTAEAMYCVCFTYILVSVILIVLLANVERKIMQHVTGIS